MKSGSWSDLIIYWVALISFIVGLSGLVPSWNWDTEMNKVAGKKGKLALKMFYVLTLLAGAFAARDTYLQSAGGGGYPSYPGGQSFT